MRVDPWGWLWGIIFSWIASTLDQRLEDYFVWIPGGIFLVLSQGVQQCVDALEQAVVDESLVFESLDLDLPLMALLVDLVLLCADE